MLSIATAIRLYGTAKDCNKTVEHLPTTPPAITEAVSKPVIIGVESGAV
jgi:hypothetical protein